jgi:hypothetical protein
LSKQSFNEWRQSLRNAGGSAWDNLDVDQELAAIRGQPQGTEARVCDDITERQAMGINKYGKTVEQNQLSLRQWLQHAYEECLDQAIYLRRAIEQIDRKG